MPVLNLVCYVSWYDGLHAWASSLSELSCTRALQQFVYNNCNKACCCLLLLLLLLLIDSGWVLLLSSVNSLLFQVGFELMDRELLWHGFAVSFVQQSVIYISKVTHLLHLDAVLDDLSLQHWVKASALGYLLSKFAWSFCERLCITANTKHLSDFCVH